ncbi:uncharacterized protein LOC135218118 [Macrobrachium nipponense]|uniref:uncharacterized protein LOC135218118 n=1 Tax=Macrobrachium nipponense TaxID=159736 RepID=UPI0030C7D82E
MAITMGTTRSTLIRATNIERGLPILTLMLSLLTTTMAILIQSTTNPPYYYGNCALSAAEIEKRDAEPVYGSYRPTYGYGYGHTYGTHPHNKRSVYPQPEPEASYPSRHYPVYPPHGHQYGKRSADPERFPYPYAEHSYGNGYDGYPRPAYHHPPYYHG